MEKEIGIKKKPVIKAICPYIQDPFDDCYCMKLRSQDIEKTVYLCSNNFESCQLYRANGKRFKRKKLNHSTIPS